MPEPRLDRLVQDFAGTGHDTYVHTGLQALAYLRNRSALIWPALWRYTALLRTCA